MIMKKITVHGEENDPDDDLDDQDTFLKDLRREGTRGSSPALSSRILSSKISSRLFGTAPVEIRLGRYLLMTRLGSGGMNVVYSALDQAIGRVVAIKMGRAQEQEEQRESRIYEEAKLLASIRSKHVMQVYDMGSFEDQPFLVMEYVDGRTMRKWMRAQRSWRRILSRFLLAGDGLAAIHNAGIIHRDFKPDNVMIGRDVVRVFDLGLALRREDVDGARAVHGKSTERSGTRPYMSVEYWETGECSFASDQYSYCVSLLEALADGLPEGNLETHGHLLNLSSRFDDAHEFPDGLVACLRRGLAQLPESRWPSMGVLIEQMCETIAAEGFRVAFSFEDLLERATQAWRRGNQREALDLVYQSELRASLSLVGASSELAQIEHWLQVRT